MKKALSLTQAFEELCNSEEFRAIAKEKNSLGGKYRMYLSRYQAGDLKTGALVDLLVEHGYTITAKKESYTAVRSTEGK